jgi:hypothetical protein
LTRRLGGLENQVRAMGDALKALGDARLRRITQAIALVGFPFTLATSLATPVARQIQAIGWVEGAPADAPAWLWWSSFGAVGLLAIGLVLALRALDAPRRDEIQ